MRIFHYLASLSALFSSSLLQSRTGANAQYSSPAQWPLHDNGLNDVVQWDHYSYKINGKRLFVFSGEIHYWRIPVPEVWEDLLEKIKAAGFTAFAFYGHWGYHTPNNHTLDFETGAHDFAKLFEIAKKVGLYVIVRPGPYVNAEANAGGFPLWVTTGAYGELRDDDPRYTAAWKPYFSEYSAITSKHLVTNGGNVLVYQIENEYGEQWENVAKKIPNVAAGNYMAALEATARENGIDVPLIHNDPNMRTKSWSKDYAPNATGAVDIAGLDSYPSCWSCNLNECTGTNGAYVGYLTVNYYDYFTQTTPTQPSFFPEFQGGSYNPWGGPEGGCPADIGADFANLFYRNLISQRVTAVSLYMMYGGTNWGAIAAPVTATSYDYSSPISENRKIDSKYYETKNLAMFTRVAEDLTVTNRLGDNTGYTTNSAVAASELRNPNTNAAFYVTIHAYSPSSTKEQFKIHVSTSIGNLTIPQQSGSIVLNGHQSKILVTDFKVGKQTITYSTAEVLTYSIVDGKPIVVLWAGVGEAVEFHIKNAGKGSTAKGSDSKATFHKDQHGVIANLESLSGNTILEFDNGVTVIVADKPSAYLFWAPNLSADPFAPVDKSILVQGPYLVRNAAVNGKTLVLTGDISNATTIEIFASKTVKSVTWNGKSIGASRTAYGSIKANIAGTTTKIKLPTLSSWKVKDTLPERLATYDDSGIAWVDADHTTTPNPTKPDTLPVLYVDDYDFHNSFHLFRGYFNGSATGVSLSVQGGQAFGWSAWVNGKFLGSFLGNTTLSAGNLTFSFANVTLDTKKDNVLLVAQDNTGHDLRAGAVLPRGILKASLEGGATFSKWKIAGTAGGDEVLLDPIRGPLNEGGLTAERLGWHLPGFDDSKWSSGSPSKGFSGAGISFYRTVVPLKIPTGIDASFAFIFNTAASKAVRVQLFVNGYQYARFNPYVGNEIRFPVPPGILNYNGDNTIGLAVWAQSDDGAKITIELEQQYVVESSWSSSFNSAYLRPGWTKERLAYA
ncbi:glycoside hydrolase family 35 protein [Amniculicola lignicola CBS 123094]|uniref:beta-galactosidase n=1 Tax=Amniculicola lignicola CBS 123094 TaxID=1392246 RepID=A0A6A5WWQ2_9PLEO|nr:glycoside hydrolase family 35 protein [Amniculicola lignicola CBS 123094]